VRNRPIAPAELEELEIIVSLVGPTEPIESMAQVDPMSMGLLVRADQRTAVLLPGEARTTRWQLAESRRKAGIGPKEPVQLFRFPTFTLMESALGLRPAPKISSSAARTSTQGETQ
jgi:AMMECR1 domain-containing protein